MASKRRASTPGAQPPASARSSGTHSHTFAFHIERAKQHRWRLGLLAFAMGSIAAIEAAGGILSGSLALLADAAHSATDSLALFVALIATHVVTRAAHAGKTFGYHRAEILAAFANAVVLVALAAYIIFEAIRRLAENRAVDGALVTYFGFTILVIEIVGLLLLRRIQGESLNARSAFLHLAADLVSTLGVIAAGVAIHLGGAAFYWTDPVISAGIALLLAYWAYRLIKETGHILMEGTPGDIDPDRVRRFLEGLEGIKSVHDLHVWTLTSGLHTMSAHVVADHFDPRPEIAQNVRTRLTSQFGLGHTTIQLEDPRWPCEGPHE